MLRLLRPRWIDLILIAAILSLGAYLRWYPSVSRDSPWGALWPNLTTDLAFVWLTARVIDGLSEVRQRRMNSLTGLRGALNFLMRTCDALVPHLDEWRIRDLENEDRWFRIKLNRSRSLRREERSRALEIVENVPAMAEKARRARRAREEAGETRGELESAWEAERKATKGQEGAAPLPFFYDIAWLQSVQRAHGQFSGGTELDPTRLQIEIAEAQRQLEATACSAALKAIAARHLTAMSIHMNTSVELKRLVDGMISAVRDNEMVLLERIRD